MVQLQPRPVLDQVARHLGDRRARRRGSRSGSSVGGAAHRQRHAGAGSDDCAIADASCMPVQSSAWPRLIAHLDMDAFYASVELLRYPELRGRPVVIGGGRDRQPRAAAPTARRSFASLRDYAGRGVITTSTYEARALGVFSAMGMMKAAQLAPDAVLLPVDFDEYRKYSRLFKDAVRAIAPVVEDRGIDEIYVDLSDLPGVHDDGGRARRRGAEGGGARARPASPARSASRRTSCCRRSPPSSTSPTA